MTVGTAAFGIGRPVTVAGTRAAVGRDGGVAGAGGGEARRGDADARAPLSRGGAGAAADVSPRGVTAGAAALVAIEPRGGEEGEADAASGVERLEGPDSSHRHATSATTKSVAAPIHRDADMVWPSVSRGLVSSPGVSRVA